MFYLLNSDYTQQYLRDIIHLLIMRQLYIPNKVSPDLMVNIIFKTCTMRSDTSILSNNEISCIFLCWKT